MENIADNINTEDREPAEILFGIQQLHSLRRCREHAECQQRGGTVRQLQIRAIGFCRPDVLLFHDLPRDMRKQHGHKRYEQDIKRQDLRGIGIDRKRLRIRHGGDQILVHITVNGIHKRKYGHRNAVFQDGRCESEITGGEADAAAGASERPQEKQNLPDAQHDRYRKDQPDPLQVHPRRYSTGQLGKRNDKVPECELPRLSDGNEKHLQKRNAVLEQRKNCGKDQKFPQLRVSKIFADDPASRTIISPASTPTQHCSVRIVATQASRLSGADVPQ